MINLPLSSPPRRSGNGTSLERGAVPCHAVGKGGHIEAMRGERGEGLDEGVMRCCVEIMEGLKGVY